jgi:hypothetical protein
MLLPCIRSETEEPSTGIVELYVINLPDEASVHTTAALDQQPHHISPFCNFNKTIPKSFLATIAVGVPFELAAPYYGSG